MCKNKINDGAPQQEPKPIYKLSEIVAALKEDRVEIDTLAVLACVTEDGFFVSLLDIDRLIAKKQKHIALIVMHGGLPQLMWEQVKMRPETMAIFAAADARAKKRGRRW